MVVNKVTNHLKYLADIYESLFGKTMEKKIINLRVTNQIISIFLTLLFITANIPNVDNHISKAVLEDFRTPLILIFLISLSFIILDKYNQYSTALKSKKYSLKGNKDIVQKIRSLSADEKYILSLFINDNSQEKALSPTEPAVAWLENIKLIVNTNIIKGTKRIYRIDPTVMKELKINPNCLY